MRFTRKRLALLGGAVVLAAAIAVPVALSATFPGTLSITDDFQNDRLFRDGVPSNCWTALPKANPGLLGDATLRNRDTRTFTNATPKAQCVHVFLTHQCLDAPGGIPVNAFSQANAPFDPLDPSLNYLGDAGQSGGANIAPPSFTAQHFSFVVPAFSSYDVTVAQVDNPLAHPVLLQPHGERGRRIAAGTQCRCAGAGVTAARLNPATVDHR